ncbi:hypothetical protein V6N11_064937 [Hibiscus sabdariffa]|uniref:Uncharacterized protein n=1 Tax=Hibiscus sabdariffa TaxID=183260 RepID=A0ABR2SIE6_9ROSI
MRESESIPQSNVENQKIKSIESPTRVAPNRPNSSQRTGEAAQKWKPTPLDKKNKKSHSFRPKNYVSAAGIEVFSSVSHTLFNLADTIEKGASYYLLNDSYSSLMQLMSTNEWRKTTIELSVIF